jgi:two-component system sensor histidine kinase BaeS
MSDLGRRLGMAARIGVAAFAPALVVLAIMAAATWVLSRALFERLMVAHGASAAEAGAMFEQTVGWVAVAALIVGAGTAGVAAWLLGRHLARPLDRMVDAARLVESGDLSARVGERPSIPELGTLAEAFDTMAATLQSSEQVRRDFVVGAAHELLTPLTNLEGYLEALRDGVVPADEATIESLLEEARRLTRLSRALLQTASGGAGTDVGPSSVDIAQSIGAASALIQPALARGDITLETDVPTGLAVRAAPDQLAQVLFNLLHNASRHAAPGSVVRIHAEGRGESVRVSVTNTGDRIPAELSERVFERFFRVDPSRDRATGGAGIGLAVVKEIVEKSGGRVGVESDRGGTRFWFTLPHASS